MMRTKKPSSNSYDVGYGRPPQKFRFKRGQSGNPSGKRRKASRPISRRSCRGHSTRR